MPKTVEQQVTELKSQLGDYEITDKDFYESDEVSELESEIMFQYFRGELDEYEAALVVKAATESKLFLHDLISIGEIIVAGETAK